MTEDNKEFYKQHFTQLAPDLIDGLVKQSAASDVYSFGVMAKKVISVDGELLNIFTPCISYHYCTDQPTVNTVVFNIKKYPYD